MLLYITAFRPTNISFIGYKTHFNGMYQSTFGEKGTISRLNFTQKIQIQAGFPLDTSKQAITKVIIDAQFSLLLFSTILPFQSHLSRINLAKSFVFKTSNLIK